MSRARASSGRMTALVLVGFMVLSIPTGLAPALVTDSSGQTSTPERDTNITATLEDENDTEPATVSTPVQDDAVETEATEPHDTQVTPDLQLIRRIRTLVANRSNPPGDRVLDATEMALVSGQQIAAQERKHIPSDINGGFARQQPKLHGTRTLLETNETLRDVDDLTRAVRLATVGTKLQAAQLGRYGQATDPAEVALPATQTPNHTSPSAAAFALLDRHDVTPTAEKTAEIRALDDLPEPTRSELTDFLNAYLAYEHATHEAYAEANRTRLRAMAKDGRDSGTDSLGVPMQDPLSEAPRSVGHPPENASQLAESTTTRLQAAGVNVSRVVAARTMLLTTTLDLHQALSQTESSGVARPASHGPLPDEGVLVAPVMSIDLAMHNTTYTQNYAVQLDAGGNDTYQNNAGGNNLDGDRCTLVSTHTGTAAALVDLGGNDTYTNTTGCGQQGGGFLGSGFLLDAGDGDDTYTAGGQGTNGGGRLGVGFLLDAGGSDTYIGRRQGTNGGGSGGLGFLLDANGDDTYTGKCCGVNGGGSRGGVGFLVDASGDDEYNAGVDGVNGGGVLGSGFLLDAAGSDRYIAKCCGANGGAYPTRPTPGVN